MEKEKEQKALIDIAKSLVTNLTETELKQVRDYRIVKLKITKLGI